MPYLKISEEFAFLLDSAAKESQLSREELLRRALHVYRTTKARWAKRLNAESAKPFDRPELIDS